MSDALETLREAFFGEPDEELVEDESNTDSEPISTKIGGHLSEIADKIEPGEEQRKEPEKGSILRRIGAVIGELLTGNEDTDTEPVFTTQPVEEPVEDESDTTSDGNLEKMPMAIPDEEFFTEHAY